ncbi:MAG: 3-oxocholest-4-en-26-oate---CoA ligase [Cryptosporangiaceae bacterium]|nr:3-oxocholest-4-en-26-oate---CoA ligase [Cryptosporangiaceae bacterium]
MVANIADLFEHACDAFPDRLAVVCGDRAVTFGQLEERANRLAHYLAEHGVGPGSHVGVYGRNSIELVESLIAAYKLRAVPINVNYRYVENELRYLFRDADIVALVHDRQYAARVAAVLPGLPAIGAVVVIDDGNDADAGGVPYERALAQSSPLRDFGARKADDIYMLYTGGTTGYPKGVIWRHEDIWRVLGGGIDFMTGIPAEDEWAQTRRGQELGPMVRLCLAPLIHGNAQWAALTALFAGDTVVLVPQFDPHEIWRVIADRKVNVVVLIGDAMARPLVEAFCPGQTDPSSLLAISSSAALFSPSVKEQCVKTLPNVMITESIGSSETGFTGIGLVTSDPDPSDGPRVMPGPLTIVVDEHGRPAAPGVIGRLARGGHVPLGYYKDPVKTAQLFVEIDGVRYSMPGDLARLEDDGMITLLGRGDACVNTGGEKVFPDEVEGALKSHPDIFDAIVIGVPDALLGQRVAALVQPREGHPLDLAGVEEHVRRHVAGYKVPRSVWLVDEICRTPSGKADYRWAHRYAEQHAEIA